MTTGTASRCDTTTAEPQHMRALRRANEVRLARADLKRKTGKGAIAVDQVAPAYTAAGISTIADRACYQADERARLAARGIDLDGEPACRECGCSDSLACPQGCGWAQPDLCDLCAAELEQFADPLAIPNTCSERVSDELVTDHQTPRAASADRDR